MKRVYLIDYDLCAHMTCGRPCINKCPIVITNQKKGIHEKKLPVPIRFQNSSNHIIIKSKYCTKCGICINVCPTKAIYSQYKLDEPIEDDRVHQYPYRENLEENADNKNSEGFRLYNLPFFKKGVVTGLCGSNGIGKSTVLNILSGSLLPNFGVVEAQPSFQLKTLREHIKKKEMRTHFTEMNQGTRTVAYKKQVLKILFQEYKENTVQEILKEKCSVNQLVFDKIMVDLDILTIKNRKLIECSGGELQRFAIAMVLIQKADCYLIDEPCTFLDVKKRIRLARLLQDLAHGFSEQLDSDRHVELKTGENPILVVEHDLTVLDYLSDMIHVFFGTPHQFGIISNILTTKKGINAFLKGFLKTENIRFRKNQITFKRSVSDRDWSNSKVFLEYENIKKTFKTFKLEVDPGKIYEGEILCIVGENGTGKSTFAKILVGELAVDKNCSYEKSNEYISYKPQYITNDYKGGKCSVKEFISEYSYNYDFSEDIIERLYRPLGVHTLFSSKLKELSGGQLQRVFICACLAKRASLYIIDEPSAYLDVEERIHISSVIRSITKHQNATTICIEHDIAIIDELADRLFIFMGEPGVHGRTIGPLNKREGMNIFLKSLDVTFRRDFESGRARLNKKDSSKDRKQRSSGEYFYSPNK